MHTLHLKALLLLPLLYASHSKALTLRPYRGPECGVSLYQQKQDPSCGVATWRSGRGPSCGVERYILASGSVCGKECHSHCAKRNIFKQCVKRVKKCTYNTCRNPVFGVELYKQCVHSDFGVLNYKTCRKPSFGVQAYKSCSLYKTQDELDAYIASVRAFLPEYANLLPLKKSQMLSISGFQNEVVCLIRKYQNYSPEIAERLEGWYEMNYNEPSSSSSVDCASRQESEELKVFLTQCDELTKIDLNAEDAKATYGYSFVSACKARKSVIRIEAWIRKTASEVELLREDVVARNSSAIRTQLDQLKGDIDQQIDALD